MRNKKTAIQVIESELNRLPDKNAFGDSNAESKSELTAWLDDLRRDVPITDDVKTWLNGKWSPLCDLVA
jgi:hypothetical protein